MALAVIGVADSPLHDEVISVLTRWSHNDLLARFVVCSLGETSFRLISSGEVTDTTLAEEVDVGGQAVFTGLAAWRHGDQSPDLEVLDAAFEAAKEHVLAVLDVNQELVGESLLIMAPPALDAVLPPKSLIEQRRTVVLSAEERAAPNGPNHLPEHADLFPAHVAAGVCSLLGLWAGAEGGEIPIAQVDGEVGNGATARVATSFARIIEIGYISDYIAKRVLGSVGGWPNPSPKKFDAVDKEPELIVGITGRYLAAHREALAPSTLDLISEPEAKVPNFIEAWKEYFREFREMVASMPAKFVEGVLRKAYDSASKLTERITRKKVDRWDDPESPYEAIRVAIAERYAKADTPARTTWRELSQLCVGMVDGSVLPGFVPDTDVELASRRRILVVDPHEYTPEPTDQPPITGVRPCDPRALDPACGATYPDLPEVQQEMIARYVAEREHSLVWRVGVSIARYVNQCEAEAEAAEAAIERLKEAEAKARDTAAKATKSFAKGVRRALLVAALLTLALAGVGVLLPLLIATATAVLIDCALPFLWIGVMGLLARRLVHKREAFTDEVATLVRQRINAAVTAGTRRGDVERLGRRYQEYLLWAEVLSWLLHRPWSPPQAAGNQRVRDTDLELPPSVNRAIGVVTKTKLADMEARAKGAVFPPGWLSNVEQWQREFAMRRYARVILLEADPDGEMLEDPYGDLRPANKGTPREFFRYDVASPVRQADQGVRMLEYVDADLARWTVAEVVNEVRDTAGIDSLTRPTPGWVAEPAQLQELARKLTPSVVQIERPDGGGSGIVIDNRGFILTNAHVVDHNTDPVKVYLPGRLEPVDGTVVEVSEVTDLALVSIPSDDVMPPAVPLAPRRPEQGTLILTIGFPLLLVGDPTLSWGYVSARQRTITLDRSDGSSWQLDVIQSSYATAGGASGSGVFDQEGRLVSLHCASRIRDDRTDDYMAFSVPVDAIRAFLKDRISESPAGTVDEPERAHSDGGTAQDVAAFLNQIRVSAGQRLFSDCHWQPAEGPAEVELVSGAAALATDKVSLYPRRGHFSVIVRPVVAMSANCDAENLRP